MGIRVLVVEDSETTRRLLGVIAASRQWTICGEAEDALSGVRKYDELRPDVVIIDLALPGMNGLEAAKLMSALDPTVPIFLFTVLDVEGLQPAAREAGICQVVSKFQVWTLIGSIESTASRPRGLELNAVSVSG